MKLVSVIIPCYNVEKYIDKCAESLVNQTLGIENMELIFVNDASTDTTYQKLCKWEKKYPDSIMVINCEENRKQGGARNIGLTYAGADYIGFVDSDDWVEAEMYEKVYEKAVSTGADLISVLHYREDEKGNVIAIAPSEMKMGAFCKVENDVCDMVPGGIWCNLFLRKTIIEHELYFPENLAYEDLYWGTLMKYYIKTYYIINEHLYHHLIHENSTIHKKKTLHHLDILVVEKMLMEELKERGFYKKDKDRIEFDFLKCYYIYALYLIFSKMEILPYEVLCEMQQEVMRRIPNFEANPFLNELDYMERILLKTVRMQLSKEDWEKIRFSYLKYAEQKSSYEQLL